MTHAERAALEPAVPPGVTLTWLPHADRRFVRLQAGPCPLLSMDGDMATCTVHAVRPYACRRWGCFRDDCSQPVDLAPVPLRVLQEPELQRQYVLMQFKAQTWALAHGWDRSMGDA